MPELTYELNVGITGRTRFIDFILDNYAEDGVRELAATKMRSLIELKYLYE